MNFYNNFYQQIDVARQGQAQNHNSKRELTNRRKRKFCFKRKNSDPPEYKLFDSDSNIRWDFYFSDILGLNWFMTRKNGSMNRFHLNLKFNFILVNGQNWLINGNFHSKCSKSGQLVYSFLAEIPGFVVDFIWKHINKNLSKIWWLILSQVH